MQVLGGRASLAFGAEPDIKEWADRVALNPARVPPERACGSAIWAAAARFRAAVEPGMAAMAELAGVVTSRYAPVTLSRMIEQLVEQIEGRFAELERQMSDPEVIADRERYAEVGREYRHLQPAQALAVEYRKLPATSRAPASCSRTRRTPSCAPWSTRRLRGSPSSRRRSAWRWSSATPTTTRT